MIPVDSSIISHFDHDPISNTLTLRFHPTKKNPEGAVYTYENVPIDVAQDLINAPSVGSHFSPFIKGNYPVTKQQ